MVRCLSWLVPHRHISENISTTGEEKMRLRHIAAAVTVMLLCGSAALAQPSIYYYPSFAFYGPFTFSGNSGLVVAGTIPMINGTNQNGSVFVTAPQDVTQSFTAQYTFFLQNPTGATPNGGDGLAFVIQGDGPAALGGGGTQLGYGDGVALAGHAIQKSLAVALTTGTTNQFELFANTNNSNLDVPSAAFATQTGSEGDITNVPNIVTVTYDAPGLPDPTGTLSVLFNGNSIGLNNVPLPASLQSLVGGPTGYFGFTSSSDATNGSAINIENFVAGPPVPEPSTLGVLAIGGIALLKRRPRRK
jgi:hypothetical protein